MDWVFFAIVGIILFVVIVGVLVLRYFLMLRLDEIERKEEIEEEARDTAKANSGL